MNPFMAAISVILHLKRTCPVCKRDQVVPASKRSQTVPCKFCGADVPPRKGLWCLTSTRVLAKLFISSVKMHLSIKPFNAASYLFANPNWEMSATTPHSGKSIDFILRPEDQDSADITLICRSSLKEPISRLHCSIMKSGDKMYNVWEGISVRVFHNGSFDLARNTVFWQFMLFNTSIWLIPLQLLFGFQMGVGMISTIKSSAND